MTKQPTYNELPECNYLGVPLPGLGDDYMDYIRASQKAERDLVTRLFGEKGKKKRAKKKKAKEE